MYPPLDARLLEARLSALVMAVGQLALLAQSISGRDQLDWIDEKLNDMDKHLLVCTIEQTNISSSMLDYLKKTKSLQILRKAAIEMEEQSRIGSLFNSSQV